MKTQIAGNPFLTLRSDRLHADGVSIEEFIKEHGTPSLIYMKRRIHQTCEQFLNILKKNIQNLDVFYSYKTNFQPEICNIIHSHGIHAEVVSRLELKLALDQLNEGAKIILGTPYLTEDLLKMAIENKVALIDVLSQVQLTKLVKMINASNSKQEISFRIRPDVHGRKLGILPDEGHLEKMLDLLGKTSGLELKAIHCHHGTQLMNPHQYAQNVSHVMDAAELIERLQGIRIKNFNLGGGFPEAGIMKESLLEEISFLIHSLLRERGWDSTKIIFEPGRYLVADAGIILATILEHETTPDQHWIRLDVGNHNCPTTSNANYRFFSVEKIRQGHDNRVVMTGCLPSERDILAMRCPFLPQDLIRVGEHVMIVNAGAYTQSWGLRFPYPMLPQFLVEDGEITHLERIPS
ncbi:MAG: diaminopimelate decarboxylase family protein [Candidatus Helarchaeota archaeon]